MITVTLTHLNGRALSASQSRPIFGDRVYNLRPNDLSDISSDAVFEYQASPSDIQTWRVLQQCDDLRDLLSTDLAEAGAEVTTNKATGFGTINDTLYPSVEAVVEVFRPIWYGTTSGTDTYTATLAGLVPTAYYAGMTVNLKFGNTNTGAATINLNSLGAKAIRKGTDGATALSASNLVVTKIYTLIYDGTNFQINL